MTDFISQLIEDLHELSTMLDAVATATSKCGLLAWQIGQTGQWRLLKQNELKALKSLFKG